MRTQEAIEFVTRSGFRGLRRFIGRSVLCATAVSLFCTTASHRAEAQTYTILHNFNGSDGASPDGTLVQDYGGIYGTTYHGGEGSAATCYNGCGAVLNVQTGAVLHSFSGADGQYPYAGLIVDASGILYGTTYQGGSSAACYGGCGVVFKLDASGQNFTVLHSFSGADGQYPLAALVTDNLGNLYGTTTLGGSSGQGTVFKLDTSGRNFTVLHNFSGADGQFPYAGLILDGSGNLYGTTVWGGASTACNSGCGTVFQLNTSSQNFTMLRSFHGGDGANPYASLLMVSGSLYGTTAAGGSAGNGTVFKLNPANQSLVVLHNFGDGTVGYDGANPYAGLSLYQMNNNLYLFGTTANGGYSGNGALFELNTAGQDYIVMHSFLDGTVANDGTHPSSGLMIINGGLLGMTGLYGTTASGGSSGNGTYFLFQLPRQPLPEYEFLVNSLTIATGKQPGFKLVSQLAGNPIRAKVGEFWNDSYNFQMDRGNGEQVMTLQILGATLTVSAGGFRQVSGNTIAFETSGNGGKIVIEFEASNGPIGFRVSVSGGRFANLSNPVPISLTIQGVTVTASAIAEITP